MRANDTGITVDQLGAELYPANEPSHQKHKARAVVRWLSQTNRAREQKDGRWVAVGAPRSADGKPAVLADMVIDVVSALGRPVGSGDVLRELQKANPKIEPTHVYKTIFRVYRGGRLHRGKRAGRAVYSIPGGNHQ